MTKSSKTLCFFVSVISLVSGVIFAGRQYASSVEINWIAVVCLVAMGAAFFIVSIAVPDIEGPAQAFESAKVETDASEAENTNQE